MGMRRDARALAAKLEAQVAAQFMEKHGYTGVNNKRRSIFKFKYPLHTAVKYADTYMIRLLLRLNADPTLRNSSGETPPELAAALFKENEKLLKRVLLAFWLPQNSSSDRFPLRRPSSGTCMF